MTRDACYTAKRGRRSVPTLMDHNKKKNAFAKSSALRPVYLLNSWMCFKIKCLGAHCRFSQAYFWTFPEFFPGFPGLDNCVDLLSREGAEHIRCYASTPHSATYSSSFIFLVRKEITRIYGPIPPKLRSIFVFSILYFISCVPLHFLRLAFVFINSEVEVSHTRNVPRIVSSRRVWIRDESISSLEEVFFDLKTKIYSRWLFRSFQSDFPYE